GSSPDLRAPGRPGTMGVGSCNSVPNDRPGSRAKEDGLKPGADLPEVVEDDVQVREVDERIVVSAGEGVLRPEGVENGAEVAEVDGAGAVEIARAQRLVEADVVEAKLGALAEHIVLRLERRGGDPAAEGLPCVDQVIVEEDAEGGVGR